jgi:hypothetical protein
MTNLLIMGRQQVNFIHRSDTNHGEPRLTKQKMAFSTLEEEQTNTSSHKLFILPSYLSLFVFFFNLRGNNINICRLYLSRQFKHGIIIHTNG